MKLPLNWTQFLGKKVVITNCGHRWIGTVVEVDYEGRAALKHNVRIYKYPPMSVENVEEFK